MSDTECYCMLCETFFEGPPQNHRCNSSIAPPSTTTSSSLADNSSVENTLLEGISALSSGESIFHTTAVFDGMSIAAPDNDDSTNTTTTTTTSNNNNNNNNNNNTNNISSSSSSSSSSNSNNLQPNWDKALKLLVSQNVLKGKEDEFKELLDDSGIDAVSDMPYVSLEIRSKLAALLKDAKRAQFLESCGM